MPSLTKGHEHAFLLFMFSETITMTQTYNEGNYSTLGMIIIVGVPVLALA